MSIFLALIMPKKVKMIFLTSTSALQNITHWVAMLRSVVVSGRKCKMPTHWYQTYWPRSVMWMLTCEWIDQHLSLLTHWGRVTHLCVGNLTIIDSDNGLLPGRRQAIIRTNAGILLIGPLGTNFGEIWTGIQTFPLKKIHLEMSSGKCRPFFSASMC